MNCIPIGPQWIPMGPVGFHWGPVLVAIERELSSHTYNDKILPLGTIRNPGKIWQNTSPFLGALYHLVLGGCVGLRASGPAGMGRGGQIWGGRLRGRPWAGVGVELNSYCRLAQRSRTIDVESFSYHCWQQPPSPTELKDNGIFPFGGRPPPHQNRKMK